MLGHVKPDYIKFGQVRPCYTTLSFVSPG